MAAIAAALGVWNEKIVFIGGAIAPLLQTDPPMPRVRATDDIDAIVATVTYADQGKLEGVLRDAGFKHAVGTEARQHHAHRWISPTGMPFDLVPTGNHLGTTGNPWDRVAFDTAVRTVIHGVEIRHASAPGFLVLKWEAYKDRGSDNPRVSTDIEDILAVLASRPAILAEIAASPVHIRSYLRTGAATLLAHQDYADSLDAHLNSAANRIAVITRVRKILSEIAADLTLQ